MKFYNNIFAIIFRYYSNNNSESSARFVAAMVVGAHILGIFFLFLSIVCKIFYIDARTRSSLVNYQIVFYLFAFIVFRFIVKYYSQPKVESMIDNFEGYTRTNRIIWGLITLSTFILEYGLTAFLLSK